MTRWYLLQATDRMLERRAVDEYAEGAQHLWHSVILPNHQYLSTTAYKMCRALLLTSKHSQMPDILKGAIVGSIQRCPNVCDEDLCTLEEADSSPLEACFVAEGREVFGEEVDQPACRMICFLYQSDDA